MFRFSLESMNERMNEAFDSRANTLIMVMPFFYFVMKKVVKTEKL